MLSLIEIAGPLIVFLIKIFIRNKEDKEKALIRFQNYVNSKQDVARYSDEVADEYDRLIDIVDNPKPQENEPNNQENI